MSDERRYDEDEVQRIFDLATEAEATGRNPVPSREGLTLSELKRIGAEVGIPEELISQAAAAVGRAGGDRTGRAVERHGQARLSPKVLGLPLGVEHEVDLPRNLTDEEWGRLVMDVRRTFSAKGRIDQVGAVREWRNGNLYVAITPSEDGAFLSMGTFKGNVRPFTAMGLALLGIAAVLFVVMAVTGEVTEVFPTLFLGALGAGFLGVNAVQLPPWARARARQLEEVGARALELTAGDDAAPASS